MIGKEICYSRFLGDLGGLSRQYVEQIKEGIIEGVRLNDKIPDYTGFRLNVKLLNKYERRSQIPYTLTNILVFNEITVIYKVYKCIF